MAYRFAADLISSGDRQVAKWIVEGFYTHGVELDCRETELRGLAPTLAPIFSTLADGPVKDGVRVLLRRANWDIENNRFNIVPPALMDHFDRDISKFELESLIEAGELPAPPPVTGQVGVLSRKKLGPGLSRCGIF